MPHTQTTKKANERKGKLIIDKYFRKSSRERYPCSGEFDPQIHRKDVAFKVE